eukprot:TRINITY_DN21982_c0_g2_i1.p1 TRINITY_DN21982_c0_g2~~TRINITY_DN21982_c0_g2_i1.p1  ORF type:complete len:268 (+),score=32.72 TRINITY_DN21982_c0_g2_i1:63-806(+)
MSLLPWRRVSACLSVAILPCFSAALLWSLVKCVLSVATSRSGKSGLESETPQLELADDVDDPEEQDASLLNVSSSVKEKRKQSAVEFWLQRAAYRFVGSVAPSEVVSMIWRFLDENASDRRSLAAAFSAASLHVDELESIVSSSRSGGRTYKAKEHLYELRAALDKFPDVQSAAEDGNWLQTNRRLIQRLCDLCAELNADTSSGNRPVPHLINSSIDWLLAGDGLDRARRNMCESDGVDPHLGGRMG